MAKVSIKIREGRIHDLGAVVGLWEMLAKYHAGISSQFVLADDAHDKWSKYLAKRFSEKSTKLVVAEEGGKIIGFMLCLLSPNTPVFKEKKLGIISDVYVKEDRRKKGITKMMLNLAVKWFRKNKVRTVQLGVAYANLEGRATWNQLGFKPFLLYKRLDLDKTDSKPSPSPPKK